MLGCYETCRQTERSHQCADCKRDALLVTRWSPAEGSYEVYCPRCGNGERFLTPKSLTQQWREDPDSVPPHIANKLESKYGGRPLESRALATIDQRQMTQRISHARWLKDLSADDRIALAELAVRYSLDPVMNELVIYEGKPYITVGGLIRTAHRQPAFAGLEDRPMTAEEKTAYGIKAPVAWIVKIYRRDWQVPVVGTGVGDPANPLRNNPVERNNPQWMARSRAIRQAIKLAFPHSLPFDSAEDRGVNIDVETGEIIDTTASVVEEPQANGHQAQPEPEPAATMPDPEGAAVQALNAAVKGLPDDTLSLTDGWQQRIYKPATVAELSTVGQELAVAKATIPGQAYEALVSYWRARKAILVGEAF